MVTPTTATAGAETSMDMVRLMEGPEPETRIRTERLVEKGSQGTNTAMGSLVSLVKVPTTTATRTRLEEEDTATGLREGGLGPRRIEVEDTARDLMGMGGGSRPGRMELEVEAGTRPIREVAEEEEELEPPEPPGPPPVSHPS